MGIYDGKCVEDSKFRKGKLDLIYRFYQVFWIRKSSTTTIFYKIVGWFQVVESTVIKMASIQPVIFLLKMYFKVL